MARTKKKKRTFRRDEYADGDGMSTRLWGPSMWHVLHTISFNYPVKPTAENKKQYRAFVENLQHVLPCKHCRSNLTKNLKSRPLRAADMASRDAFSRYVYALHEQVNKMLGKTSKLSYCDVRERYEHFRARCDKVTAAKEHKGCTTPLHGIKTRCILHIVPDRQTKKRKESIQIAPCCLKSRRPKTKKKKMNK
jgi:hypothetical protein